MTQEQKHRLDQMTRVIQESAERLVDDTRYSNGDIMAALYQQGLNFLTDQRDQKIIDIGALGLAYAIRRIAGGNQPV